MTHAGHTQPLAREFFASALYVAMVLLAALVALPRGALPDDLSVVGTMLGTAAGLVIAHLVAFRFAADLTSQAGVAPAEAIQEAAAGLAGGLAVAVLASVPYIVWDGEDGLRMVLATLAILPALTGMAIARLRGRSWGRSLLAAAAALTIALVVVTVKYELGH